MPYIIPSQRGLEYHRNENVLVQAADFLKDASTHPAKGIENRDFCAYLIDQVYGEPCFTHSTAMAASISPQLLQCANLLAANICKIHETDGGREGLLNYTLTRLFNETYPSARYKDYNQIAGVLSSLLAMSHPGIIELLGMLACCRDEYYRKYAAPYEELKEQENGSVGRPDAPPAQAY